MIRRRRKERAEEMFALDEIQRGDTRRERIDGGIASIRKIANDGAEKAEIRAEKRKRAASPRYTPVTRETIGPPIGEFPIDGSNDCRADTLSLPYQPRVIYTRMHMSVEMAEL